MDPPYVTSGYCCKYFRFLLPIRTHYHLLTLNIRKKLLQIFVFAQMLCCKYQTSKSFRCILQNNCKYCCKYYQFLLPKCTHYHFLTNHFIYLNYTLLSCCKYLLLLQVSNFQVTQVNMAEKLYKLREVLQHLHQMISCIDLFDTLHIAKGFCFNSCFLCFAYFFNQTLLQFSFETKSTLVSTKNCNKNSSNFSVW